MKRRATSTEAAGFTLLELVVVMGILSGFLVMLVQLVDAGLRLFSDGEVSQMLADRTSQAQRVIGEELRTLRGSANGIERSEVHDRLVVQSLPIGVPLRPEPNATRVQVMRGAVHLAAERELVLLEAMLAVQMRRDQPQLSAGEVDQQVQAQLRREPLRGIGNLLLLPWRQSGTDDALLDLRAGWLLPGQLIDVDGSRPPVDPFKVAVPGSPDLPATLIDAITVPLLSNLLHVEFLFWSQRTQGWSRTGASGGSGAERIWDSARGGLLVDENSGGEWAFDRGPASLDDPTDDIHPHAIRVVCVVAQPATLAPEGLLAEPLDDDAQGLVLVQGDHFPGSMTGGWVKVRGEWMRYTARNGDFLRGLQRGQRGTKAIVHPAGARLHVGRTVEFVVPIAHAKDDWNG